MLDLFDSLDQSRRYEVLRLGAVIMRGYSVDQEPAIVDELRSIVETSPFRRMVTLGGHTMSVTVTKLWRECSDHGGL
jgi:alkylated DNA repair protein (DNA oxidative demethylase)